MGISRDALILMRQPSGAVVPVTLMRPGPVTVRQDGALASAPGVSPMVETRYAVVLEHDPEASK